MRIGLLLLLVGLVGCSTMAGMRTEPLDAGATRLYEADLETAVEATRKALLGSALEVDDVEYVDERTWMFLAKRKTAPWTHGEVVRVIVHQIDDEMVSVRVLSKRRIALEFTARSDWSDAVFAQLALDMNEVNR